jgi:hypothetical protein
LLWSIHNSNPWMLQPVCPSLQHLLKEMESCAHYKYQLYFLLSSENYCNYFVVPEHPTTGTTVRVPIQHTMMFSPITTWSAQHRMTHKVAAFLPVSSHRQPKAYAAYHHKWYTQKVPSSFGEKCPSSPCQVPLNESCKM